MSPQKSCGELEEVITRMLDGDHSGKSSGLRRDRYFAQITDYIFAKDNEKLQKGIGFLKDDFDRNEVDYVGVKASISIMLAYASCRLEDQKETLRYATVAKERFLQDTNLWYQALAFWFLGIVYWNNGSDGDAKKSLKAARERFEKYSTEALKKDNHETAQLCQECIHRIEQENRKIKNPSAFKKVINNIVSPSLPSAGSEEPPPQ